MKHIRNAAFAFLAVIAGTVLASSEPQSATAPESGIEVLSIDSSAGGDMVTSYMAAPMGSVLEAIMNMGGADQIVDQAMLDPATGTATVHFPMPHPANRVQVRAPDGIVLSQGHYSEEFGFD